MGDDEGDMLEWPSLEGPMDGSFLLLFNKIHCKAVSVEKDTYLTPFYFYSTKFIVKLCLLKKTHI